MFCGWLCRRRAGCRWRRGKTCRSAHSVAPSRPCPTGAAVPSGHPPPASSPANSQSVSTVIHIQATVILNFKIGHTFEAN